MEFFRNITAPRPIKETLIVPKVSEVRPARITPDPIGFNTTSDDAVDENAYYENRSITDDSVYYGGGGDGFSFGEEEVVPETATVSEEKSNIGKTILILSVIGLSLWLLSGDKKMKSK